MVNLKLENIEIKPCPECHAEADVVVRVNKWGKPYRIECPNGCMKEESYDLLSGIKSWNYGVDEIRKLNDPNVPKIDYRRKKNELD